MINEYKDYFQTWLGSALYFDDHFNHVVSVYRKLALNPNFKGGVKTLKLPFILWTEVKNTRLKFKQKVSLYCAKFCGFSAFTRAIFLFCPNLINNLHHRVFLYSKLFGNSSPTSCASMMTSNIGLVQLQFSTFGACLKSKYFPSRTKIPLNNVNMYTYIDFSTSSRIQRTTKQKFVYVYFLRFLYFFI